MRMVDCWRKRDWPVYHTSPLLLLRHRIIVATRRPLAFHLRFLMKSKLFNQTVYFVHHLWGHIRRVEHLEQDELTV